MSSTFDDLKTRLANEGEVYVSTCLIEEMSELTKVLTKKLRNSDKFKKEDLEEEIAHVLLLCDCARHIFKLNDHSIYIHQLSALLRYEEAHPIK